MVTKGERWEGRINWEFGSNIYTLQFISVQSLSHVRLFATPWIAARQASLSITISRSSLKLTSIKSVMPSTTIYKMDKKQESTIYSIFCNKPYGKRIWKIKYYVMGFPGGSVIKNLPANAGAQETQVWFLSWEDPTPGGGNGNSP